ncbi:tyrosine-type recombinase/integrase [Methylobacterium sp. W2]|uniref:tyrosine-type recombinase/integrase n=1 Tax=Methylobacterium sp. W2 TaxID=2598107 RepID=UPI001D0C7DE6|nr:site-specific integrase [Methylobacterium sp. W2]MCC0805952.1 tyrosine-type recombinase/integrase [Methylobacterium sp. W2]
MARRADANNLVRLSRTTIKTLALEPDQPERVWWDCDLPGFGYRLRNGRATWVIRPPRNGGRSSLITIGQVHLMEVAAARRAALEQLANGTNPRETRRTERAQAGLTVETVFERYSDDAQKRLRPSTLANLKTHLNQHWKGLHAAPLASVRRADVAEQLRSITASSGPHAALRARRTLSTVFAWAIGEGLVEANPVVGTNPPGVEVRRDRVLNERELADVWGACPPTTHFGRIIRLLILTGQRRDEVAGMTWGEIDFQGALWRLPAARSKNGIAHDVPLSKPALDIVADAPQREGRALVFGDGAGPFSGFSKAKVRLDKTLDINEPWRIHDLRRTAATGMADLGALPHVVEAVLNHVSGSRAGVAGIYNRATYAAEKRAALDLWAETFKSFR